MTNIEDMLGDEWDLTEVTSERAQPKETVSIFLNELASYAKAALYDTYASTKDGDALSLIEDEIEKIDAELEASKYVIHITAIPSRMREDIASKAIHKFPIKANMLGQDDPINALNRKKFEQDSLWHAQIENVVNPLGKSKRNWSLEEIQSFSEGLPTSAQKAVDEALLKLTKKAEKFIVASSDPDF